MKYANLENWTSMWTALGCKKDMSAVYEGVVEEYSKPHRFYHTLQHIEDCLGELEGTSDITLSQDIIALAIWYHDLVYNTQREDNEQHSAIRAMEMVKYASLPSGVGEGAAMLIIATRHLEIPDFPEVQLICDIDLAILGQSDQRFDEYERQIRREYDWVPEDEFISSRGEILRSFLNRSTIYSTQFFRAKYEEQARRNIAGSLAQMGYSTKEM